MDNLATESPRWKAKLGFPTGWSAGISLGGFLLIWWLVTDALNLVSAMLLPSPVSVVEAAWALAITPNFFSGDLYGGSLIGNAVISLGRVFAGFLIAVGLGLIFGTLVGTSRILHGLLNPMLQLARQVPPISYIPLALIWFGLTETSIVSIIIAGAFWPIFLNTVAGIHATPPLLIKAARVLGASTWQLSSRVYLPYALPQIFTGVRLSFGLAWSAVVAAELVGSSAGIGYLIMHARLIIATPDVIAGMAVIGVIGLTFDSLLLAAERKILVYPH